MTEYVYKLKNGKVISVYADEKGNISITKDALEMMINSWNDGYQKGFQEGYNRALEDFKEYLLRHKHLVREFETGYKYEAVKIEFITDTNSLFLKELNSK